MKAPMSTPSGLRRLTREFSWVVAGQAAGTLGALVGVRLLTQALKPAAYGEIGLGLTLVTLSQQIVFGPLCSATLRSFAPAAERNELTRFFGATKLLFQSAIGALVGMIALLGLVLVWSNNARWLPLLLLVGFLSVLSGYNSMLDGIQNAARQRPVVAWHQGAGQWLRYLLAAAAVLVIGASSMSAILGYTLGAVLVLGSQVTFFRQKIRPLARLEAIPDARQIRETARR